MERANSNLLLQNLCIMQQNEELRRMARKLDQENKALLAQIQRKHQHQQQAAVTSSSSPPATQQHVPGGGASSGGGHSASAAGGKLPK